MTKLKIQSGRWLCPIAFSLLLASCGSPPLPSPADSSVARQSLETMLDCWQRGEQAERLQSNNPAIVAIDDDWRAGLRLAKYQVKGAGVPHGANLRASVLLSLQDSSGKAFQKEATYIIGTNPKITIARSDREEEDDVSNEKASAASPKQRGDDRERD